MKNNNNRLKSAITRDRQISCAGSAGQPGPAQARTSWVASGRVESTRGSWTGEDSTPRRLPGVILPADSDRRTAPAPIRKEALDGRCIQPESGGGMKGHGGQAVRRAVRKEFH